jgi:hypothetical protein
MIQQPKRVPTKPNSTTLGTKNAQFSVNLTNRLASDGIENSVAPAQNDGNTELGSFAEPDAASTPPAHKKVQSRTPEVDSEHDESIDWSAYDRTPAAAKNGDGNITQMLDLTQDTDNSYVEDPDDYLDHSALADNFVFDLDESTDEDDVPKLLGDIDTFNRNTKTRKETIPKQARGGRRSTKPIDRGA